MWLTRVCIQHPVFATMLMLALMVFGLASSQRLMVEEFPNVEFPFVVVYTNYPGASPEAVETDVTRKLEEAANTIAGIDEVSSVSAEGLSTLILKFDMDMPAAQAAQDVREKIDTIRNDLPEIVKDPLVQRYDPTSVPVVSVVFTSQTLPARELSTYLDQTVSKRLQTVMGVGRVSLLGITKREIHVELNPQQMQALGVSTDQIVQTLRNENAELPSGTLRQGRRELVVQVQGRVTTPAQFGRLIVARRGGAPVYLDQVATVRDAEEERDSSAFLNQNNAVAMDIIKASGANVIETVDGTRAMLKTLEKELPAGIQMTVLNDSARGIRASLTDVVRTLVEGGVLAVLIVLLFLGTVRSTVITGLTLPIALLGTLAGMALFGFSLNVMTLMALSLCIGLLIDDAIVVRENIVRHAAMGKSNVQAALDGTREIGLAVLATTLTIVAVFVPVAFMQGIIGRFFYQFGVTVAIAVLLSMFVSFTLDPMLSSIWPEKHETKRGWFGRQLDRFSRFLDRLTEWYGSVLQWSLGKRWLVMLVAVGSLVAAFALSTRIGKEFVPTPDLGEMAIKFDTPVDSSLAYTESKVKQVSQIVEQYPEVQTVYSGINTLSASGRNRAVINVTLKPKAQRERSLEEMNQIVRRRLQTVAGINVTSVAAARAAVSGGLKPIIISIKGTDLNELQRLSDEFIQKIRPIPGLVDIESSLKEPKPTVSVRINRDIASDAGLNLAQVGNVLRLMLAGSEVTNFQDTQGNTYKVIVQLPTAGRQGISDLQNLYLPSSKNGPDGLPIMIPLGQVATFEQSVGASQINRRDLFREVQIDANNQGRPAGDIGEDIKQVQNSMKLPPGYSFVTQGANQDMTESAGYAASALIMAIVLIYMVLASQFNSFLYPLAIMASLPLSLIGVFGALYIFGSTLNIFSIIGIIMLMGLVTKNAILIIDFIKKAVDQGAERTEAIVEAGKTRLRPILMTTTAMVMGMVPLALGLGEGAEQRAPMAHAIIGGIITSTILTLVVVPIIYTYLDGLKRRTVSVIRRLRRRMA